jgi:hypothetical protein
MLTLFDLRAAKQQTPGTALLPVSLQSEKSYLSGGMIAVSRRMCGFSGGDLKKLQENRAVRLS